MKASPAVTAAYEAALPADERVERKSMFGMPCAFVNRQMFFGTFEESIVARIGPERVAALVGTDGLQTFSPMPDRPWRDYVRAPLDTPPERLAALAADALAWTLTLPAKAKKPDDVRKADRKEARKEARKAAKARAASRVADEGDEVDGSPYDDGDRGMD